MKPDRPIPKGYVRVKVGDKLRFNDMQHSVDRGWHRTALKTWELEEAIDFYYGPYIRKVTRK